MKYNHAFMLLRVRSSRAISRALRLLPSGGFLRERDSEYRRDIWARNRATPQRD